MVNGFHRLNMIGIGFKESFEINSNKEFLQAERQDFFQSLYKWYDSFDMPDIDRVDLLHENVYNNLTNGEFDDDFYISMYHQALVWHKHGVNISRVMLILTHCRQLFIMLSEKQENHLLARALCHSIDLGQSIISDVYQLHDTLKNLRKKSQAEVSRMRRSFHLISADTPEDLIQVYIDHQNWKMRAYACALGEIEEGDFPFSTDECRLGIWLNAGGIEQIPEQERATFNAAHEQVHLLGYKALKEAREQHPERIVEFLNDMELASDEVCRVLLERIEDVFTRLASLDSLTGLPNRKAFDAQLSYNVSLSNRHGLWVGLILLDIDHFKSVNDKYGHDYGDQVLVEFAKILECTVRLEDHVYRWGGEEFAVLVFDKTPDGIELLAERLRDRVESSAMSDDDNQESRITISCGAVSIAADVTISEKELFSKVDRLLYNAKKQGRNRVCYQTLESN